jgi:mRNA interferase RelE/StbE
MTKEKFDITESLDEGFDSAKINGPFSSAEEVYVSLKIKKSKCPIIKYSNSFKRCFQNLSTMKQDKFYRTLKQLLEDPKHPSLRTGKLEETKILFECRMSKSFRFIFQKENNEYYLRYIGDHSILDQKKLHKYLK